jgi:hypothetical protein
MKIPPMQLRLDDYLAKGVKQMQTLDDEGNLHFNFEYELKGHTHRLDWVARSNEVTEASLTPENSVLLVKRMTTDVRAWFEEATAYGKE